MLKIMLRLAAVGLARTPGLRLRLAVAVYAAIALSPAQAETTGGPFTAETVRAMAADLAKSAFVRPEAAAWKEDLDYDRYRQIRFRKERTIWRGEGLGFEMQVMPTGWLFKQPIEINLVDNDSVRAVGADNSLFDLGGLAGSVTPDTRIGISGFRITAPMNRPDVLDEVIVFQGASYFRALSRGQIYGLSARGLALNVGQPGGEEFPFFRRFWIEKPQPGAAQVVIHALLDSPSLTGAYRFVVAPGGPTSVDIEMTLYPRKELTHVGIAPLTSMFLLSGINRARISDFRPSVHDSDGLAMLNGRGERLWRPLNNPLRLQTSSFLDQDPRGFGLIQRARDFSRYQDLEAHYERRPSAWVEPRGGWGAGAIELIEIPSDEEIHDNIVAYWKPQQPLAAGKSHTFAYRLTWPEDAPRWAGAYVAATRSGLINGPLRKTGAQQFAVDFAGLGKAPGSELPNAKIDASAGAVSPPVVEPNPAIDGLRVSFSLDPKGAGTVELRLVLETGKRAISDTWLYRWTKQ